MKLKTALIPSIAAMSLIGNNLAYGLGQISIIVPQLAVGDQDPDIEQGFKNFDEKLVGFYSGTTTTQVVDLAEAIKAGVKLHGIDNVDKVTATGFKQTLGGMHDHIKDHDTGGDFVGKVASIASTMDMLDERIRVLTPAGDADLDVDKLARGQQEAGTGQQATEQAQA